MGDRQLDTTIQTNPTNITCQRCHLYKGQTLAKWVYGVRIQGAGYLSVEGMLVVGIRRRRSMDWTNRKLLEIALWFSRLWIQLRGPTGGEGRTHRSACQGPLVPLSFAHTGYQLARGNLGPIANPGLTEPDTTSLWSIHNLLTNGWVPWLDWRELDARVKEGLTFRARKQKFLWRKRPHLQHWGIGDWWADQAPSSREEEGSGQHEAATLATSCWPWPVLVLRIPLFEP